MNRFIALKSVIALTALGSMSNAYSNNSLSACCAALSSAIGQSKVAYPNSTGYEHSATTYFAQQEGELAPSCYVKPECSQDVATVVKTLALLNDNHVVCPFAVRSGGHHTVVGIANIHSGITIDLGNLNQTTVSADHKLAYVEPGSRWGAVYDTLVPLGLAVPGGRISDIGVGGFLSGGGISYFGASQGFGCDTVENFEIVLATGEIANANQSSNADLFKALKGGMNNFGIITRFDMKPFELGQYWGGQLYYTEPETTQLLDAFVKYTTNPEFDVKSALIVSAVYAASAGHVVVCDFAYTEAVEDPAVFQEFTSEIPAVMNTTGISNLSYFAAEFGANSPNNLRQTSITATVKPSAALIQEIYTLWNATVPLISSASNLVYTLTYQPLPVSMLAKSSTTGGNSLGLTAADGPLVVLTLTTEYTSAESDTLVTSTSRDLFNKIQALATAQNESSRFIYGNYADATQPVIASYGTANQKALRKVSHRVDPKGFFQSVQPGGFKLGV